MNVRVPFAAGGIPPETGASRKSPRPEASTALRTSRDVLTSTVEVSRKNFGVEDFEAVSRPVLGSVKTLETAGPCGSEVMIVSCLQVSIDSE